MESPRQWDDEVVEDALDVLKDVTVWELTRTRWEEVAQLLEQIADAHAAGRDDDLRAAVAALELSGPTRAFRIGGSDISGIPEPVLERRNWLVHALTRPQPAPSSAPPPTTLSSPPPDPERGHARPHR